MFRYLLPIFLGLQLSVYATQSPFSEDAQKAFAEAHDQAVSFVFDHCGQGEGHQSLDQLVTQLAEKRAEIAKHDPFIDAKLFNTRRGTVASQGQSTPLNSSNYDWLRNRVRSLVEFHYGQKRVGEWVASKDGTSRYCLQILEPKDWPTVVTIASYKAVAESPQQISVADENFVSGMRAYYFLDSFMRRGCFEAPDHVIGPGRKANTADLDLTIQNKLFRLMKSPEEPIDMCIFVLYTEIKVNGAYLPGYFLVGSLDWFEAGPINSICNSLMTICHPPRALVDAFFNQTSTYWDQALAWDGKDESELMDRVGTFIYYWIITMPTVRGSASLGEWLTEGLYAHFGYKMSLDKDLWHSVDNAGFCHWNLDQFLAGYRDAIKLTKKEAA